MRKHNTALAIVLTLMLFLAVAVALAGIAHAEEPVRTARQDALHEAAEILRAAGYAEDSDVIKALQSAWNQEQEDLSIIAKTIAYEANPDYCEWEHSIAVGAVILNRVKSQYFPNSVKEVVAAPMQYSALYTKNFEGIGRKSWEAAKAVMDGEHSVPDNCFWQAEFPQGESVWKTFDVDTGWYRSTTYICRGISGVRDHE